MNVRVVRRLLGVLRRSKRSVSVRVLELLVLLYERDSVGASTLVLERELGRAGTRRVLSEALKRDEALVRRANDVWVLSEAGLRVLCEFFRGFGSYVG